MPGTTGLRTKKECSRKPTQKRGTAARPRKLRGKRTTVPDEWGSFEHFSSAVQDRALAPSTMKVLWYMWKTSEDAKIITDYQQARSRNYRYICSNCSKRGVMELPKSAEKHKSKDVRFFNELVVHALGLEFTSVSIRDALFEDWRKVFYTAPWWESMDATADVFKRRVFINGKVWSMYREGDRIDATYNYDAVNKYLLLPNCFEDSEKATRYAAFAATLPHQREFWDADEEGSFLWFLKGPDGRGRSADDPLAVAQYVEWVMEEERKEPKIFYKRHRRMFMW